VSVRRMKPRGPTYLGRPNLPVLCAMAAVLLGVLFVPTGAEAGTTKRCGTIVITSEGMLNRVTVRARGVRCRYARRMLLSQKRTGRLPAGWRCSGAGVEGYCRRGRQRVSYGPPFETLGRAQTFGPPRTLE